MQLVSRRTLAELQPVEYQADKWDEETQYWVFGQVGDGKWENMTVLTCQKQDREYPKTFGHYHGKAVDETYKLVSGSGLLVLQKRVEGTSDQIEDFVIVRAQAGDEVVITPEWGHAWVNVGDVPMVSLDDWRGGHTPGDYELIAKLHGLAYYVLDNKGEVELVRNEMYKKVPTARWMTALEYATR